MTFRVKIINFRRLIFNRRQMPIIKSAIKRVRQTKKRQDRNRITKRRYRDLTKEFTKLVEAGKIEEATKIFPTVQKAIDMADKKNLLHNNTAGRLKSRLVKMLNKTDTPKKETKPAPKKAPAKKTTTKKTETK